MIVIQKGQMATMIAGVTQVDALGNKNPDIKNI